MKQPKYGDSPYEIKSFEKIFYNNKLVKNRKWSRRIFYYLLNNNKTSRKELLKNLSDSKTGNIDKGLFHREINRLKKENIIKKERIGKEIYYTLTEKYRMDKVFNQIIYFNKIQSQAEKENLIFSEEYNLQSKNTIYGFPDREKMNDFENRIMNYISRQISNAFRDIQKLKISYELRKKIEKGWLSEYSFPDGVISEELALKLLINDFSEKIFELLYSEKGNKKSFCFLSMLMNDVCQLAKDLNFKITENEGNIKSPYPEKFFYTPYPVDFVHDYLFMVHPSILSSYREVIDKRHRISSKVFKLINNNSWFFDRKNYMTFEKLEEKLSSNSGISYFDYNSIIDYYEKTTNKKFYPYDLSIFESLALITTHSLSYSEKNKSNIDFKLNSLFDNYSFLSNNYVDKNCFGQIVFLGEHIILETMFCKGIYKRDPLELQKFLENKKLNKYFSKKVINFYLDVIDFLHHSLSNFDNSDVENALYYKGFGENGLWYDKKQKYFYKISDKIFTLLKDKIRGNNDLIYHKNKRWGIIRNTILNQSEIPSSLKKDKGLYSLNKLILFIDSKLYFNVIRDIKEKRKKELFRD